MGERIPTADTKRQPRRKGAHAFAGADLLTTLWAVRFVLAPDSLQNRTVVFSSSGYLGADVELQVKIGDLDLRSELTLSSFVTSLLGPL